MMVNKNNNVPPIAKKHQLRFNENHLRIMRDPTSSALEFITAQVWDRAEERFTNYSIYIRVWIERLESSTPSTPAAVPDPAPAYCLGSQRISRFGNRHLAFEGLTDVG